ncbi:MAG: biotin--[acetyl-CoA-carboxylase] ligase [Candidatus Saccharicenans sp.]
MPATSVKINFGDLVFKFDLISSTMDFARQLAKQGYPEGTAVLSNEQVQGRGTKGRTWHSARGLGLYVSFILRPSPSNLNLLPLAAGLAAAEAAEAVSGLKLSLKWPNDLIYKGKKLGGILCEAGSSGPKTSWAIAGLGINLNHSLEDFPADLMTTATSLFLITGRTYKQESVFRLVGNKLQFWYNTLEKGQTVFIKDQYQKRLSFHRGQTLILRTEEGEEQGQFEEIEGRGGLRVKIGSRTKVFYASEIVKVLS